VRLSRPLLIRLAVLAVLVAVAVALVVRTVPRMKRYRAVEAACSAVEQGDWTTAITRSEHLVGSDPEGLRAAQCRCLALLQTGGKEACADLLNGLLDDPATGDWLPSPELTSLVVERRGDRGELGKAAELAHRGAITYPTDPLLLLQELKFRTRTEDEKSVLDEMERRLPKAGEAAPLLQLRLARRYGERGDLDEAQQMLGNTPDSFPSMYLESWFVNDATILAERGDIEGLDKAFDEWRRRGGDPLKLEAIHAVLLNIHQLNDPAHPTLDLLREAAARAGELDDQDLAKTVYTRLIGTLVVGKLFDEARATYDRAVEQVGDLGMITREDIFRSETRAVLGESTLEALQGTLRFHLADRRPGDTLLLSPRLDEPVDSAYVPIEVPASGTVEVVRGVGTWPQRWVLRDAEGHVAGSGAVWSNPDAPVDVQIERRSAVAPHADDSVLSSLLAQPMADRPAGKRRVFQVILDCGDWRLVEYGRARGEMPFFDQALHHGRRAVLDSVPPYTATAVAKLVYPNKVGVRSLFDLVHQLGGEIEGLSFVGRNPFAGLEWVLPEQRQIFETFAEHGHSTVNLLRSGGKLAFGRQAQVRGPGDAVRQLEGYRASRPLTPAEQKLLRPTDETANTTEMTHQILEQMAADFDMLDLLAEEPSIDFVSLRVASLDLMTHSHFQAMNRTAQDDGSPLLYRTYRYVDQRLAGVARRLRPGDVLIVMSDHGIRTPMEHDHRAMFVALGTDIMPGRIDGSPAIREVTGWMADLMGVETDWPGAGSAHWITRRSRRSQSADGPAEPRATTETVTVPDDQGTSGASRPGQSPPR